MPADVFGSTKAWLGCHPNFLNTALDTVKPKPNSGRETNHGESWACPCLGVVRADGGGYPIIPSRIFVPSRNGILPGTADWR